jgi:hypothetical protein
LWVYRTNQSSSKLTKNQINSNKNTKKQNMSPAQIKNKIIDFSPIFLVILLDAVFTVLGQPKAYWENFTNSNEANPIASILLGSTPIIFFIGVLIYSCLLFLVTVKLKKRFRITFAIFLFLAHFFGSASWILHIYKNIFGGAKGGTEYFLVVMTYILGISFYTYKTCGKYIEFKIIYEEKDDKRVKDY